MGIFDESESSGDENVKNVELKVNKKFAGKFEHQERLKELHRNKELLENGVVSDSDSESESEDEDAELLTPGKDLNIMKTILSLRTKDPKIYDSKTQFHNQESSDEDDDDDSDEDDKPQEKKKKFKDVLREQLLTHGADIEGKDSKISKYVGENVSKSNLIYDKEQERIRQEFLKSTSHITADKKEKKDKKKKSKKGDSSDESEDEGLLQVKPKSSKQLAEEELELKKTLETMKTEAEKAEDAAEQFLANYMLTQKWKDNEVKFTKPSNGSDSEESLDYEQEEEELEKLDRFESKYNFRFEELQAEGDKSARSSGVTGLQVAGHAREVQGSMRRVDDKRKIARELRAERKEKEKRKKEEEIKRLKNLKRQELKARLSRIGEIGGLKKLGLDEDLLDDEWDPAKHEAMMAAQFDDNYYNEEDEQFTYNDEHFDEDNTNQELLGMSGYDDSYDASAYPAEEDLGDAYGEEGEEGDYDEMNEEDRAEVTHMVDDLYKLDYEDIVAGIPCRFKYKSVEPEGYGLTAEDIMLADDAELNKFVSLKHISAYNTRCYAKSDADISKKRKKLRTTLKERLAREAEEAAAAGKEIKGIKKVSKKDAKDDVEAVAAAPEEQEEAEGGDAYGEVDDNGGKKKRKRRKNKTTDDTTADIATSAVPPAEKTVVTATSTSTSTSKSDVKSDKKISSGKDIKKSTAVEEDNPVCKKAKPSAENITTAATTTSSTAGATSTTAAATATTPSGVVKIGTNKERKLKVLEEKKKRRNKLIKENKDKQTAANANKVKAPNSSEALKKRLDLYQ